MFRHKTVILDRPSTGSSLNNTDDSETSAPQRKTMGKSSLKNKDHMHSKDSVSKRKTKGKSSLMNKDDSENRVSKQKTKGNMNDKWNAIKKLVKVGKSDINPKGNCLIEGHVETGLDLMV